MENLLIKGDSREKLKTLSNFTEKVKMIYIDPPYNTERVDMAYNDKRELQEFYQLLDETLSKSHSLLREDGIICVSISAHSLHHIRNALDSVYGYKNYAGTIIRVENAKKQKIGNASLKENFEYVVCYYKNKNKKKLNFLENKLYIDYSQNLSRLNNTLNPEQYIDDLINLKTENISIKQIKILKNVWSLQEQSKGLKQYKYFSDIPFRAADINMYLGRGSDYDIEHPIAKKICKRPKYNYPDHLKIKGDFSFNNNVLRFNEKPIFISNNKILCGNIIFGIDERKIPDYKNNLDFISNPDMIINITGSDDRYLTKLFGGIKVFDYPKPIKLIDYLISLCTDEGDIVLDFFAGSGTTGESAYKNNRKFILIQKDDIINKDTLIKLKNKGFSNIETLFDITKTRLKLANVEFKNI